jgi:MerR family mercuric resistance operon transcriptional regulator
MGTRTGLRSGQVAVAAGVNLQTLRYYQRRGLIAEPERTLGGHRLFPADTVRQLRAIKTAQRLGFSLDEVADLLAAGTHPRRSEDHGGLHQRAADKLTEVQAKIADLQAIAATLRAALAYGCDDLATCASRPDCPLPFAEPAGEREAPAPRGNHDTHHDPR